MAHFLGIDVGSISTNIALIDERREVLFSFYARTHGRPIESVQKGLKRLEEEFGSEVEIIGVGTTGSGRQLAGALVGADVIKNEITAHAIGALEYYPDVRTIFEIGGQDSKLIVLRDGVVVDFAMNTICAAGTGSFLDHQAARLGIPIERFGELTLDATEDLEISGRCTVFAESDLIHKQQMGHSLPNLVWGLCRALARNYLANLGKGKDIVSPIVFQGGVAANAGMTAAFERELKTRVKVPEYFDIMGAIGVAIIAMEAYPKYRKTRFRGFDISERHCATRSFRCTGCSNRCEVVEFLIEGARMATYGGRCGKWECEHRLARVVHESPL